MEKNDIIAAVYKFNAKYKLDPVKITGWSALVMHGLHDICDHVALVPSKNNIDDLMKKASSIGRHFPSKITRVYLDDVTVLIYKGAYSTEHVPVTIDNILVASLQELLEFFETMQFLDDENGPDWYGSIVDELKSAIEKQEESQECLLNKEGILKEVMLFSENNKVPFVKILAGAAMVMHGLQDTTRDVDVLISDKSFLRVLPYADMVITYACPFSPGENKTGFLLGRVDASALCYSKTTGMSRVSVDNEDSRTIITTADLEELLEFYTAYNRPKDQEKIVLLKEAISKKNATV